MNTFPVLKLGGNRRSLDILERALNHPVIIAEKTLPIIEDTCIEAHLGPDGHNILIQTNNENQTEEHSTYTCSNTTYSANQIQVEAVQVQPEIANLQNDGVLEDATNITELQINSRSDQQHLQVTEDIDTNNESDIGDNPDDPEYEEPENRNSETSAASEDEENRGDPITPKGRKRKTKAEKTEWDREKTRLKRMKGEEYLGYTRTTDGKVFHNKMRQPKTMGPPCTSSKCVKYKTRFCNTINLERRNSIFHKFWKELEWDQKKIYVTSLMKKRNTVRKFVPGDSRRSFTYEYFLRVDNEVKQVCKKMFLSTLGVKEWMVSHWCSENTHGMHSPRALLNATRKLDRPQPRRIQIAEEQKLFLRSFFDKLPKKCSHYCRKDSDKLYLEGDFTSKMDVFRVYQNHCVENNQQALSMFTFSEIFEEMKLSLFSPKKDQCNICVSYSAGNVTDLEYRRHIELKEKARLEKGEDKKKAETGEQYAFVMDVQAVKLCPLNNANKFYFKTKLKMHNFTIYNLSSHQCTNYWWNESEADLVSSVFTTIIISHLEKHCTENKPIVLWSDGCPYQNRNAILANALCNYAVKYQKPVTQKYLEPGHTQMECDSVHSVIERKLKNRDIFLPYDYVSITKTARLKPFPYDVEYLEHQFFKKYDDPKLMRYKSIRPGRTTKDPTVTDLREIRYCIDGKINYKLDFSDDYKDLPQRYKEVSTDILPQNLFQRRIKISKLKFDHLQDIKTTLPTEFHHFYDSLPFE